MTDVILRISGMDCGACAVRIVRALRGLPGACSLNARTRRRFAGRPLIIGLLTGVMPRGWMKYIVKGIRLFGM